MTVAFPAQVEYSCFSAVFRKYSCTIVKKKKEFIMMLYAVSFISFVLYLRYKCTTCTVHRTVTGIEHLVIANVGFFNFLLCC